MARLGADLREPHELSQQRLRQAAAVADQAQRECERQSLEVHAAQLVVERDDRLEGTRVALATGAPEELPVDSPRLVELGRDDVQAAERLDALPQPDVRAA